MKNIAAGELDTRATFQTLSAALDGFGQPTNVWTDTFTVWANVSDIRGSELIKSMALASEATTKITIRYRAGINPAMRVIVRNVIFNIKAPPIDSTGRRAVLELLCQRGLQHDPVTTDENFLLWDDGSHVLWDDGSKIIYS